MKRENNPLHEAFLEDHRQLTRGLARIRQALLDGDVGGAARMAEALDHQVGPHMEFEETVFYPELRKKLGSEFVDQLYHEHDIGRSALEALIELGPSGSLAEARRRELAQNVNTALEHAKSCGTLLSHLDYLTEEERATMLEQLLAARERGRPWTQIESPAEEGS